MARGAHHFFIPPGAVRDDRLTLEGAEGRHAARVLRVRVGETISAADGTGTVHDAVVTRVGAESVEARVIFSYERRSPRPELVLFQAVAKGERMDFVVQKAVEVGARRVVPFLARRSVVSWDAAKREKASQRWRAIALAAAKQSRSAWLTTVDEVADGVEAVSGFPGPVLVLDETASRPLRDALPEAAPETLGLVVGPEGSLETAELEVLRAAGAEAVTLGERVLRTETAGLVAMALVAFSYGSLG